MDKKLLTTVIAAALAAAPMASMADTTVYGKVHMSVGQIDDDASATKQMEVRNQASRLGFKGSEDLGNGLKANFKLEYGVNPDSTTNAGLTSRNQYVGLSGESWGEFRVGRHDTPLKMAQGKFDQFNDTDGDLGKTIRGEDRLGNVIAYISPNMSGFTLAGAGISGENDAAGNSGLADAFSLAAMYGNGPLFASVGYTDYGDSGAGTPSPSLTRVVGTYKITDEFQVGGLYSTYDADATSGDEDSWGLSAAYSIGSNKLKAQYITSDTAVAGASDTTEDHWSIGADHSFSKRTTAYVMYNKRDNDVANTNRSFAGVGLIHNF